MDVSKIQTTDQYFKARDRLDERYWADVEDLNTVWDRLMKNESTRQGESKPR